MANPLSRLFNLKAGEGRRGFLLFVYLFLVICCYQLGKAARDALFLNVFKASKLPYADMAIAFSVGVVFAIYVTIGRRVSLRNLLVGSLVLFAVTDCAFWYLAHTHPEMTWQFPALYIWIGIFGVLAPAQVWTLANYLLTTREAKRVFGLVGAGAITGWIFSGMLTKFLAKSTGTESLLLAMAVVLLLCAGIVVALWRERGRLEAAGGTPHAEPAGKSLRESLAVVLSSPYLMSIASLITLSSVVTSFAGWQFKAIAKAAYPDKNALTAFFGDFNFWAALACLVLQLLLTSRFLRRFGLGPALLVVPLALLGGELAVLTAGTLAAAILLKGCDQLLRYSLDKSSVELLFLPIPADVKLQAKSCIDTFIWRLGDGLAGFTLAIFTDQLHWSPQRVSSVNLVFIGAWIMSALVARRRYSDTLVDGLRQRRLDAERQLAPVLDRSTTDILATQLSSADPKEVLYALEVFGVSQLQKGHPAIRELLEHPEPAVRKRALETLDSAGDLWDLPRVEAMLADPDVGVRSSALLFLAHHAHVDPLTRIDEVGAFESTSIMAGMAGYLAQPGPAQNLLVARLLMGKLVAARGEEGKAARMEAAALLATLPDEFGGELETLLADREPEVVRAAVRAAARLRSRRAAPKLIELLADARVRDEAAEALVAMGDRVLGALRDQLSDAHAPLASRLEIPAVLARLGGPGAATAMAENLLETEPELRYRILAALTELRRGRPQMPIDTGRLKAALGLEMMLHCRTNQILAAASGSGHMSPVAGHGSESRLGEAAAGVLGKLRANQEQEIECIFRILSLLYPASDFRSAHYGLRSNDPVARDHALEFLDITLEADLRKTLVALLDPNVTLEERVAPILRRTGMELPTNDELAAALVRSSDPWLKACGVSAVGALGLHELAGDVEACLDSEDQQLRDTARAAKKALAARA